MTIDPRWLEIAHLRRMGANSPPNSVADAAALAWMEHLQQQEAEENKLRRGKDATVFASNIKHGGTANRKKSLDAEANTSEVLLDMLRKESANRESQRSRRANILQDLLNKADSMDTLGQLVTGKTNLSTATNPATSRLSGTSDRGSEGLQSIARSIWPEHKANFKNKPIESGGRMSAVSRGNGTGSIYYDTTYLNDERADKELSMAHELAHLIHNDSSASRQKLNTKELERQAWEEALSLWAGSGRDTDEFLQRLRKNYAGDHGHYSGEEDARYLESQMKKGIYKSYRY